MKHICHDFQHWSNSSNLARVWLKSVWLPRPPFCFMKKRGGRFEVASNLEGKEIYRSAKHCQSCLGLLAQSHAKPQAKIQILWEGHKIWNQSSTFFEHYLCVYHVISKGCQISKLVLNMKSFLLLLFFNFSLVLDFGPFCKIWLFFA